MGSVWLAEHLTLRSRVAVKLIDPRLATSPQAVARFEREARAAAALRSAHVVQVLDFGVDDDTPYIVMEFLQGESLGTRLCSRGRLAWDEVWLIISQVGRAIGRAHDEGFVHRDIKPDNIFIVDEGADAFVKVLDFGVAKALAPAIKDSAASTQVGVLLGTPHHMSPEQAEGAPVDGRSDLWSMAVVAFECITGQLPFNGSSLPALLSSICYDPIVVPSHVASVPQGFDTWFARGVARDRGERFQTAKELVEALRPLLCAPDAYRNATPSRETKLGQAEPDREPTLRLDTFPGTPSDRRTEARVPSSIPAGINRQRDLDHAALIHNASRSGALLATRHRYQVGQELTVTLHLKGLHHGQDLMVRVNRVSARDGDAIWRFDVGVQFETPLSDSLLNEIERRAASSSQNAH
jgi:serine/threonine-protein kinase